MRVGFIEARGATRLADLRQQGCLKCILPRVYHDGAEGVLVNTSGGVTGGDRLSTDISVGAGARVSMTTQAAERIYRTTDGSSGRITTRITVGAGARLHWLPQETILFDRAALDRRLDVALAPDATLLATETLVFGRAAMGEVVTQLALHDRIAVDRAGVPLYRDAVAVTGNADALLARAGIGQGAGVVSTALYAAADAEAQLDAVRVLLGQDGGVSLRSPGLLVIRVLARDSLALRRILIPVLEHLSGMPLPSVWRL
ncbi:urease accessory protein UreD [Sulfitobacter sp. HNIBRBA3233]|uniref:urease accessory protein UreD n=1 Tax=Sulfitobacter marinivivus TaxID=3158558 RepID=UPI0032DF085E